MSMFEEMLQSSVLMRNFTLLEDLGQSLNTGDPEIRKWFMVRNNLAPFFLCMMYVLFVKVLGPMIMKNRQPLELRNVMVIYNFLLVATYIICIVNISFRSRFIATKDICNDVVLISGSHMYSMAVSLWIVYLVKYVEFLDTILFVLRKKDLMITNLHVIHHSLLPIIGWVFYRTERSALQGIPVLMNCVMHIVMYTYYGLAAMGPKVRKYLWWKRYLTIAQMIQFILIVTFVVIITPLSGCSVRKTSLLIDVMGATLFFALFYNFYRHTFKGKAVKVKDN